MSANGIPETMRAWQRQPGSREPVAVQIPVPKPGPDSLLLRVLAAGVCHSDSTILGLPGMPPGWGETFVMGHEGCGEVVSIGSEVEGSGGSKFQVGDRVAVMITAGCKPGPDTAACPECSRGLQRICSRAQTYGLGHDGVFAEFVAVKHWAAVHVPATVESAAAAVAADAVLTAFHAVKVAADVRPSQTVAIYGLGGVGMNAVQAALHLGAGRVLAVDRRREAVDEAIRLGVPAGDAVCCATEAESLEAKVAAEGIKVDTTVDLVGTQDSFDSAQRAIRPGGRLVQVGLMGPALSFVNVPTVMRELDVKCSYNGTVDGLRECLDLMAKGVLKPYVETTSMDQVTRVIKDLDDGKIKGRMVLLPNYPDGK